VAAVIDGLDGRIARLLKGTSRFGAEFDSLADFLSFGVAPALVLYLWTLQAQGRSASSPA
jgi:CDP-diacylglycerol--serine O-phosphatidyltransferase